jgi:ribosomal protein S18 acetylase RimI-like enzyme
VFALLYETVRGMAQQADRVCGCRLYVEKENESARVAYRKRGFLETPYRLYEDPF